MPDATGPLQGATYSGFARIDVIGPIGMISLRADLSDPATAAALPTGMPAPGRIETIGGNSTGWMSPDELLLIVPHDQVAAALDTIHTLLNGKHFLAADVSDARAVFRIQGAQAREVLAKLCPADLSPEALPQGVLRRTRAAQIACAFWLSAPDTVTFITFRSVATYALDLLKNAAAPGSEANLFPAAP